MGAVHIGDRHPRIEGAKSDPYGRHDFGWIREEVRNGWSDSDTDMDQISGSRAI
jgi:hypothetical protein